MTQHPDQPGSLPVGLEVNADAGDDAGSDVYALGGAALFFGALTVALLWGDNWETHIDGYSGRRGAGIVDLLQEIGQAPVLGVLGLLAIVSLVLAVRSLRDDSTDDGA